VRFGVLGPVEVRSAGGEVIAVGGPRPRSLLAMLVLEAGRVVATQRLVDGLYGDEPPADAANALQSQVSRLRARLGDLIERHPAGYRLAVDPDSVDVHRFERLVAEGRVALAAGDHAAAAAVLADAAELWRGPALADVATAPFAARQITRLEELRVAAAEDRFEAALALGEPDSLLAEQRELLAAHPFRERLRGQLMRALYAAGRPADALAVFEEGRRLLADELGTDPSPELAAVHLAVLRGDTPNVQPLPAQLTSFVGRDADLARIGALLSSARLVTVTGPGGAGKTRLAIEAAGRAAEPVSFVDLSAVRSGVARAVLAALGLRESGLLPQPGGPPDAADRLLAAFADRPALLVLDNCEQVVVEVAVLAHRLLTGCPELRILATSREPLGITGESLHPLPPLEIEPALRLFAERAAAVRPGFTASDAARRICAALDGLPLAIELAAARLRTLTAEEVEARLDDRFRLLSQGSRVAPARHRTLEAVVSWSWELLEPDERLLAARFSVFEGGASAASVTAVCGLGPDVLAGLADKSFVDNDSGRYRMLDTIRAYCAGRLIELGGRYHPMLAHAKHFLAFARIVDPHLRGAEQLTWLPRLAAENANLTAALRFAIMADPELALDLIAALSWYWYLRGMRGEIAPLATELLDRIGPDGSGERYVLAVLWAAMGRPGEERLLAYVERARSIMSTIMDYTGHPYLMVGWALFAGPPADEDTVTPFREALGTVELDPWFEGLHRFGLGFVTFYAGGALADAERECTIALEKFRLTGDRWGLAQVLDALATFADVRGDAAAALELTDQALDIVGQLGAVEELAELRGRRADRLLGAGREADAHADYRLAAEQAARAGLPAILALAHSGLGELARRRGDLAVARKFHESALAESTMDWTHSGARAQVLTALGRVAEDEGDTTEAASLYHQAIDLARDNRMPATAEEAIAGLSRVTRTP
jgi:predicted ATPase/DNA-binding SARP family transcriptional activator